MKLILISPSERKDSELPYLLKMFELGLPAYHLRKTKFSTSELKHFIEAIPEKYHHRIVIHTHHELVMKFNLKGIYISRSHKKRKLKTWMRLRWFRLRKRKLQVSTATRSIESLLDYDSKYDYVLLSPVFDSLSGNFQAGFTEHDLKISLKNTKYKTYARGGISINNIHKANELGFAGVALHSSIWKSKNPLEEFIKVKEKFIELKIPME